MVGDTGAPTTFYVCTPYLNFLRVGSPSSGAIAGEVGARAREVSKLSFAIVPRYVVRPTRSP